MSTAKVEFFKKSDSPSRLESSLYQPFFLRDVSQLLGQVDASKKGRLLYLLILITQCNLKKDLTSLCEKIRAKNSVPVGWSHPFRKHPYPTLKSNLTLHDYTLIATTIIIRTTVYKLRQLALVYSIPSWLFWADIKGIWSMMLFPNGP